MSAHPRPTAKYYMAPWFEDYTKDKMPPFLIQFIILTPRCMETREQLWLHSVLSQKIFRISIPNFLCANVSLLMRDDEGTERTLIT